MGEILTRGRVLTANKSGTVGPVTASVDARRNVLPIEKNKGLLGR